MQLALKFNIWGLTTLLNQDGGDAPIDNVWQISVQIDDIPVQRLQVSRSDF